jgi:hypothetical protein
MPKPILYLQRYFACFFPDSSRHYDNDDDTAMTTKSALTSFSSITTTSDDTSTSSKESTSANYKLDYSTAMKKKGHKHWKDITVVCHSRNDRQSPPHDNDIQVHTTHHNKVKVRNPYPSLKRRTSFKFGSSPIPCPISTTPDPYDEDSYERDLEYYNTSTWNMYNRIMCYRIKIENETGDEEQDQAAIMAVEKMGKKKKLNSSRRRKNEIKLTHQCNHDTNEKGEEMFRLEI